MNEKVQPVGFGTSGHPALMDIYVGNNLRKARELKNITAEQLSKTLKIDLQAVEQYEAAARKIKAVDLSGWPWSSTPRRVSCSV